MIQDVLRNDTFFAQKLGTVTVEATKIGMLPWRLVFPYMHSKL